MILVDILVTGGAGFIGSHLCEKLLKMNHHVICFDDFDDFYAPSLKRKNIEKCLKTRKFELIEGDLRDKSKLEETFKKHNIDRIVHLAARAGVRPSIIDPLLYADVNIIGTLNLLELCKEYTIDQFIFASSSSVYGLNTKIPFNEDDCISKPISPYASSKISCEHFCYTYNNLYNIPITCLRFFTVYGPRQRPEMAIHKFTRLIDEGKIVELYGDGTSKRDYTYIDDIIEGICTSLDKKVAFEIINLGNSETVELNYLISLIENELGKKAKIKHLSNQSGDVPITYADISKAKRVLNYNPQTKIEDGIKSFVKWYTKARGDM